MGAPGGHGVLTPYTGLSLSNDSERTYRIGARWNVAPAFGMSVEGDRREHADERFARARPDGARSHALVASRPAARRVDGHQAFRGTWSSVAMPFPIAL